MKVRRRYNVLLKSPVIPIKNVFLGTADYSQNPCPVGHYCQQGILMPEECPAGTYRNATTAGNITDCTLCPAGNYCPLNASTAFKQCNNGTFCPNGTILPRFCLAGFYCPEAQQQIPCQNGFYCPRATEQRIPCPKGHYCPGNDNCSSTIAGNVVPIICPQGMYFSSRRFATHNYQHCHGLNLS